MFYDEKPIGPVFTLPKRQRRKQVLRAYRARKGGKGYKLPLLLRLSGWQVGIPVFKERFTCTIWMTTRFSVRGRFLEIPVCRLTDRALREVIE